MNQTKGQHILETTAWPAGKLFPVEYSTRNFQNIHNIQKFVYLLH